MNLLRGAAFAVGIAIVAFLFYGAIGGPVSEMHNGRIVVTTTIPQICWTFGASGMAQGTRCELDVCRRLRYSGTTSTTKTTHSPCSRTDGAGYLRGFSP